MIELPLGHDAVNFYYMYIIEFFFKLDYVFTIFLNSNEILSINNSH